MCGKNTFIGFVHKGLTEARLSPETMATGLGSPDRQGKNLEQKYLGSLGLFSDHVDKSAVFWEFPT